MAEQLPREFARQLAEALRAGPAVLNGLKAEAVLPFSTAAVTTAISLTKQGDGPFAGGVLAGRLQALSTQPQITPVWTGPGSGGGYVRLTVAVVADLINDAKTEILLASYATIPGESVREALDSAMRRGAQITLLLERTDDNRSSTATATHSPGCRRDGSPGPPPNDQLVRPCTRRCSSSTAVLHW